VSETPAGGPLRYREVGAPWGVAYDRDGKAQACMGVAVGDVVGDPADEIFVTNFAFESNTLYGRSASSWYEDVTARTGLGPPSFQVLGFGTVFLDADLDGDLDLAVANGQQPTHLYVNDGTGAFTLTDAPDLATPAVGRGLVAGDVDGDGVLDLVLTQNGGPPRLLLGDPASAGARTFAAIELVQPGPNRDAVGATVTLTLSSGRRISRTVRRGDSYLGSSSPVLHFGTATDTQVVADIAWPDGLRSRHDVPCSRRVVIARAAAASSGDPRFTLVERSVPPGRRSP
jgi:enediyne biosynthesis protein E4